MRHFIKLALLAMSSAQAGDGGTFSPDRVVEANRIAITACSHDAGAICSFTWGGKEFIDDWDHGRQLQSAITYGQGETYNPTEAGASYLTDGYNPRPSSSELQSLYSIGSHLVTETRMAFWNPVAGKKVSDHYMLKEVVIGYFNLPNVVKYQTTFYAARTHSHGYVQYEHVTGYMPGEFKKFYRFIPGNSKLFDLDDGPGEQKYPVVMCTESGAHCMGIYNSDLPQAAYPDAGFGRWRHERDNVVKWNAVFRFQDGNVDRTFTSYIVVGTKEDVLATMKVLALRIQK